VGLRRSGCRVSVDLELALHESSVKERRLLFGGAGGGGQAGGLRRLSTARRGPPGPRVWRRASPCARARASAWMKIWGRRLRGRGGRRGGPGGAVHRKRHAECEEAEGTDAMRSLRRGTLGGTRGAKWERSALKGA
jgi:hypothetical protein